MELWARLHASGMYGYMSLFAVPAIEALNGDPLGIDCILRTEPVGPFANFHAFALAVTEGDWDRALAVGEDWPGQEYWKARGRVLVGQHLIDEGEEEASSEVLVRAGVVFEATGAPVNLALTLHELRRIDPRVSVPELTRIVSSAQRREVQILRLLGDGLTNKEIAAHLHISPATVKRHISNLLSKHGMTSRRELSQLARRGDRN